MCEAGLFPRGRTSTLLSQQGLGVPRGQRGSPGCGTPSFGPWEPLWCWHRQEGSRRQEAGAGPALPDVRGYTSPRGQAAGSTAGSFAARALLPLQEGPAGRGAAAGPPPCGGHPLGKPWGSLAPRSGTQRDGRALQGCKKGLCSAQRGKSWFGEGWRSGGVHVPWLGVAGAGGSASSEWVGAGTEEQGTVLGRGAERLSPIGGVSGKLPAGHPHGAAVRRASVICRAHRLLAHRHAGDRSAPGIRGSQPGALLTPGAALGSRGRNVPCSNRLSPGSTSPTSPCPPAWAGFTCGQGSKCCGCLLGGFGLLGFVGGSCWHPAPRGGPGSPACPRHKKDTEGWRR